MQRPDSCTHAEHRCSRPHGCMRAHRLSGALGSYFAPSPSLSPSLSLSALSPPTPVSGFDHGQTFRPIEQDPKEIYDSMKQGTTLDLSASCRLNPWNGHSTCTGCVQLKPALVQLPHPAKHALRPCAAPCHMHLLARIRHASHEPSRLVD